MKKDKLTHYRLPIALSRGIYVYAVTLFLLILLAQTVRIPFTHALVLLAVTMPIPSILLLLIAMPFVKAGARVGIMSVTRSEKCSVCVNIRNGSPIPISLASVGCLVPDKKGRRCVSILKTKITLPPLSLVTVKAEPTAFRRGRYEVGVKEIWLCDLMNLVKIRKRINGSYTLAVLPKLSDDCGDMPDNGRSEEDMSATVDVFSSYDYGDVREYRVGDSMKKIHWKLSSKSDELQVRKSVAPKEDYICIICDRSLNGASYRLAKGVTDELDDRTVEEAMKTVSAICRRDGNGCLSVTTDDGGALLLNFGGVSDEVEMRYLLTALERGEAADAISLIPESASEVYYILSYLSPEQAKDVFAAQNKCVFQEFKVCLRDVGAFIPEDKRDDYRLSLDAFKTLLYENGVSFFTVTEGGEKNEE